METQICWQKKRLLRTLSSIQLGVATFVQGTVVQGDFGPRRLLSKKAFTSDKLAQIIFLFSIGYYDID